MVTNISGDETHKLYYDSRRMLTLNIALALAVATFLIQLLWWYYLEDHTDVKEWISRSELPLPTKSSYTALVVASAFCMYLEILVIRWISSEIRIFAYFKNFVLIGCFLGFGIGCYLSKKRVNVLAFLAPLAFLAVLVTSRLPHLRKVIESLPALLAPGTEVHIWGLPAIPLSFATAGALLIGLAISTIIFVMIGFLFIPVGQFVGAAFDNSKQIIPAYSINVAASLFGIVLYTSLSLNDQAPPVWFAIAGVLFIATVIVYGATKRQLAVAAVAFVACVILTVPESSATKHTYWSPYQKLTLTAYPDAVNPSRYELLTNDSWYQQIVDLSPSFVASHAEEFKDDPIIDNPYNLPYRFYSRPQRVLILGSGMGNDVAGALRNGAGSVTAVEIDPLILQLGKDLHFEKPYASPKVKVVLNDARNFIQNTPDTFDLMVFSLLDSHTTSSNYSNIRIDNFVYTVEALQAAKQHLAEGGVLIIKFQSDRPWIAGRLQNLIETVFHRTPIKLAVASSMHSTGGSFFVTGSEAQLDRAMQDESLKSLVRANDFKVEPAQPTTDNWPYFYQQAPGIPLNVILLSIMLFVVCGVFIRRVTRASGSVDWHFFWLGAGFLLLEAQVVSKVAMLFGTTWLVNSIVIGTLLTLIILANSIVHRFPGLSRRWAYAGVLLTLAISWATPVRALLVSSMSGRIAISALVLCLPAFFAGIVFVQSFKEARSKSEALGSNLFGALAGGLLESISFWTGLNSLVLLALLIYVASAYALKGKARLGAAAASLN